MTVILIALVVCVVICLVALRLTTSRLLKERSENDALIGKLTAQVVKQEGELAMAKIQIEQQRRRAVDAESNLGFVLDTELTS